MHNASASEIVGFHRLGLRLNDLVATQDELRRRTDGTVPEAIFERNRQRVAVEVKRLYNFADLARLSLAGGTKVTPAVRDAFAVRTLVLVLAVRAAMSQRACRRLEERAIQLLARADTSVPVQVAVIPMPDSVFDINS